MQTKITDLQCKLEKTNILLQHKITNRNEIQSIIFKESQLSSNPLVKRKLAKIMPTPSDYWYDIPPPPVQSK